jgi:DNA anti-recombination protein RmuC
MKKLFERMRRFFAAIRNLQKRLRQTNIDFAEMAKQFDGREEFYKRLDSFFQAHGYIPPNWEKEWRTHLEDPKPWRKQRGFRARLWISCFRGARV